MALHKRFWYDKYSAAERENFPETFNFKPGLYDASVNNVTEALDFAKREWNKAQGQTIILTVYLTDPGTGSKQINDVYSVGQGSPTMESVEYNLRNNLVGFNIYREEALMVYRALSDAGYLIDHIAMDIEGFTASKSLVWQGNPTFTTADVWQNLIYKNDADGLPIPNPPFPTLNIDHLLQDQYSIREALLANGVWGAWNIQETTKKFNEIFGDTARSVWPKCRISNYELSTYPHHVIMDWAGITGGNQFYQRFPRPQVDVHGIAAPVLYLFDDYYDTADEALASLYCCDYKDPKNVIPWVGHVDRTWPQNTPEENAKILLGVEKFGCERVIVF